MQRTPETEYTVKRLFSSCRAWNQTVPLCNRPSCDTMNCAHSICHSFTDSNQRSDLWFRETCLSSHANCQHSNSDSHPTLAPKRAMICQKTCRVRKCWAVPLVLPKPETVRLSKVSSKDQYSAWFDQGASRHIIPRAAAPLLRWLFVASCCVGVHKNPQKFTTPESSKLSLAFIAHGF